MRSRKPYHEALGVSRSAPHVEVKRAYRALVREFHPDRLRDPELRKRAEERLKEINAAWNDYLAALRADDAAGSRRGRAPGDEEPTEETGGEQQEPMYARYGAERASRDRHRAERARWLHEREERERRARGRAERLRREREEEDAERSAHERAHRVRLFRAALAWLVAVAAISAALLVGLLLLILIR